MRISSISLSTPHRIPVPDPDDGEPGSLPIDPDDGAVPPMIPEDPEHERMVDPEN